MSRRVVGVAIVLFSAVAAAQPNEAPDPELERSFRAEIEAASPAAVDLWDRANLAREAERHDEAIAAYNRVIEKAPNVDHPHRRLCSVLARTKRLDDAAAECELALKLAPDSPYDKSALASVLVERKGLGEVGRALDLAKQAADARPQDAKILKAWCAVLIETGDPRDFATLHQCVPRLLAVEPDGLAGNFMGALLAASDGNFDEGRRRLDKAREAGLPAEAYEKVRRMFGDVEEANATFPAWVRWTARIAAWVAGVWLAAMVLLFLAGIALSRLTLRSIARATASGADATGSTRERRLRKTYKAVLLLSGVYFYLSLPILLAAIVAAGGGAILVFFAIGTIPIKLVFLIGIVVLATVGAILRSVFVRVESKPPGEPFDLAQHPKLRALLDEVAAAVGTHPVEVAYLTPGTDMAVTERTGLWASVRGKGSQRALIMGVGLFEGMTLVQLRSILAHEYGHFRNQDTAGGGFALAVRLSLYALIVRLAASGVAGAFNPVWWFLRGFHRMYLGISQGASRLQEVLADRGAIHAYGSAGFVAGYRHVVVRSVEFERKVNATIEEVIVERRPLPNLYAYQLQTRTVSQSELAEQIEAELGREPTAYDSHPSPRQRIAWATQLAVTRSAQPGDDEPVWTLFADRDELERAMTSEVRDTVRARTGATIREVAPPPSDAPPPAEDELPPAADDGSWTGYGRDA